MPAVVSGLIGDVKLYTQYKESVVLLFKLKNHYTVSELLRGHVARLQFCPYPTHLIFKCPSPDLYT